MAQAVTSPPQSADAPGEGTAGDHKRPDWQHVVAVVAAAAGGAAWVSAVGSAVVGLRLENADLPVESVVALMSAEHRFAIGGGYLLAPMLVALVGFAVDWMLLRWKWRTGRKRVAAATIVVASVAGGLVIQPDEPVVFALQCAALLLVVNVVMRLYDHHPAEHHRIDERLAVFVAALISAGAIALAYEQLAADPTFDTADIRLSDGVTVEGGYITTTDTAVLLITRRPGDCPTITAVRRDRIERARIGPTRIEVDVPDPEACTRTLDWDDFP